LWDLPLRIFHWGLVASVSAAIATGLLGGSWMEWHAIAGLTVAGLLTFRIVWGVVGSTHARFASFWPTPRKIKAYLSGQWSGVGHNPLGALSVFALLSLLGIQVATGLTGTDDIAFNGPLSTLVDYERSLSLTNLHHRLTTGLYVLLGLHVAAIAYYVKLKKQDLVKPMLNGEKVVDKLIVKPRKGKRVALILALSLSALAVYGASGYWIAPAPTETPASVTTPASVGATQSSKQAAPSW
jgi:cytochrome b